MGIAQAANIFCAESIQMRTTQVTYRPHSNERPVIVTKSYKIAILVSDAHFIGHSHVYGALDNAIYITDKFGLGTMVLTSRYIRMVYFTQISETESKSFTAQ